MLPTIRAVIFDYGEVICAAPEVGIISSMAEVLDIPPEQFRALYSKQRQGYDRGDLTAEEYWFEVAQGAGRALSGEQVEQLRRIDVEMWSNVNADMLRWVRDLRAHGVRTAVLSNMHDDMVHHAKQNFGWLADFDCLTLSSQLHLAKPDAEIYHHCLKCLAVAPAQALFLDDREANIQGARAVGMQGIVMQSLPQLRAELQAIGFSPLPS